MVKDTIKLLGAIANERKMKAAVKGYGKRSALVGACLGAWVAGVPGAAVGALLGSWMMSGRFKPVSQILMELPPAKQEKLFNKATAIIWSRGWTNAAQLIRRGMWNDAVEEELLAMLITFISKELQAEIRYDD